MTRHGKFWLLKQFCDLSGNGKLQKLDHTFPFSARWLDVEPPRVITAPKAKSILDHCTGTITDFAALYHASGYYHHKFR